MLLLLVIAFLATPAFFVSAKRKNYHPGRAASLPFLFLGLLLIADHFLTPLLETVVGSIVTSHTVSWGIVQGYNVFLICIYLTFISRNWIALTRTQQDRTQQEPNDC